MNLLGGPSEVERAYDSAELFASRAGKLLEFQHAYQDARRKPMVCQDAIEVALAACGLAGEFKKQGRAR